MYTYDKPAVSLQAPHPLEAYNSAFTVPLKEIAVRTALRDQKREQSLGFGPTRMTSGSTASAWLDAWLCSDLPPFRTTDSEEEPVLELVVQKRGKDSLYPSSAPTSAPSSATGSVHLRLAKSEMNRESSRRILLDVLRKPARDAAVYHGDGSKNAFENAAGDSDNDGDGNVAGDYDGGSGGDGDGDFGHGGCGCGGCGDVCAGNSDGDANSHCGAGVGDGDTDAYAAAGDGDGTTDAPHDEGGADDLRRPRTATPRRCERSSSLLVPTFCPCVHRHALHAQHSFRRPSTLAATHRYDHHRYHSTLWSSSPPPPPQ
eukprot:6179869-Pleurochrysis_carterae.AAC.1